LTFNPFRFSCGCWRLQIESLDDVQSRMALHVDPIFAADLANASGSEVWVKVRNDVGKRLRAWYAQKDMHHRQCALAAMLTTGSDDFKDIVVPLLADANDQVRIAVYCGGA
jgi:hypothetical protein